MPRVDEIAVREMDRLLTSRADLVFIASDTLLATKKALNPNTIVSPHGVDVGHFTSAMEPGETPDDIARLPRPIVGFFGLIERWIDLDLIEHLAERRPSWSFVMIGHVATTRHKVMDRPNVHFLGQRPYSDLPHYAREFDAAIIPYRLAMQVMHANPLKLREYLATGKPIVSVRTPEVEKFADVVEIADNYEQFADRLDALMARKQTVEEVERRVARIKECSWEARVQKTLEIVNQHLRANEEATCGDSTLTPCG
jgi:glycosyltransferase involved in cell wall biosynthesis